MCNINEETGRKAAAMGQVSTIRLIDGSAEIEVDSRTFTVSRPGHTHSMCPGELVVGALGS